MVHGLGDAVGGLIFILEEVIKCIHENRVNDALLTASKAIKEAQGYAAVAKVYQARLDDLRAESITMKNRIEDLTEMNNKLRQELKTKESANESTGN